MTQTRTPYNAGQTLTFDEASHSYTVGGVKYPSVTQVIDRVLNPYVEYGDGSAAVRGSIVHSATQFHDEGDLNEEAVDPDYIGYLESWKALLKVMDFGAMLCEVQCHSERHRFAGTCDRVCTVNGEVVYILDLKSGVEKWTDSRQTAGYELMLRESRRFSRKFRRAAVYLNCDGKIASVRWHDNPGDQADFLAALRCYKLIERNR